MDLYSSQLKVNASLIGSLVYDFIDSNYAGDLQVHSVFGRVVNIKTPGGLVSIVTQSIGKAASYIVADRESNFLSLKINTGDLVRFNDKCLNFGDHLVVDLNDAYIWKDIIDSSFKWVKSEIPLENFKTFKAAIDRLAASNSAWDKISMDKDFNNRINKLTGDYPVEAVKSLIGLGPGLTPSGDDVLLGFLAVVNTCDNYSSIRDTFRDEILRNLKFTSDISASFLKMAAQNRYHEYVQEVLYSVVNGLPENVMISVKKLLSIGATSGTDIATGIYLGLS